ncbi:MAG: enoyl-CoA hydratase/isomerase family protein [Promethearchaeota archaeon]
MKNKTLKFELLGDGIGILTLNRPDQLNAINFQMSKELHSVYDHLMTNLDCRVLILKAEGRVFCAGLNFKESTILQSKKKPEELKEKFFFLNVLEKDIIKAKIYAQWRASQIIVKMRRISQPIIALVQGVASGVGFAFALASDFRIASKEARSNNVFIEVGFSGTDLACNYHLIRLIGMSKAAEILYTGRFVEADEAEKIGLILKVVDKEKLLESGLELASDLLTKSPLGLRMTKEAINLSMDSPSLETIIQLENRTQMLCSTSSDLDEGIAAFFEKRKPKYPLK